MQGRGATQRSLVHVRFPLDVGFEDVPDDAIEIAREFVDALKGTTATAHAVDIAKAVRTGERDVIILCPMDDEHPFWTVV